MQARRAGQFSSTHVECCTGHKETEFFYDTSVTDGSKVGAHKVSQIKKANATLSRSQPSAKAQETTRKSHEKHVRVRKEHTKSHQPDQTQIRKGPAQTSQARSAWSPPLMRAMDGSSWQRPRHLLRTSSSDTSQSVLALCLLCALVKGQHVLLGS